jgi:hypothetical protein
MSGRAAARQLTREDVVLAVAAGADGPYDFDPIRLMKACFLVSQQGRQAWRGLFNFEPYDYGPFDRSVYVARDVLLASGMLQEARRGRYPTYSPTEQGNARVGEIATAIGEHDAHWLAGIGSYVTSKSFSRLLDEVYAAFPAYAVRSVAR